MFFLCSHNAQICSHDALNQIILRGCVILWFEVNILNSLLSWQRKVAALELMHAVQDGEKLDPTHLMVMLMENYKK